MHDDQKQLAVIRAVAIWIFGLVASAFIGGALSPQNIGGAIGGMCAFACIRLWLREPRRDV